MSKKNKFIHLGNDDESKFGSETAQNTHTKVVRDTFTFPEKDHLLLGTLKQQYLRAGVEISKSEIIRAGLHALSLLNEKKLIEIAERLERVKTGKPKK